MHAHMGMLAATCVSKPQNTLSLATVQTVGKELLFDFRRTILSLQLLKLYSLNIHHCEAK